MNCYLIVVRSYLLQFCFIVLTQMLSYHTGSTTQQTQSHQLRLMSQAIYCDLVTAL